MRSYLILLFCLPLPFGANVTWAWGLFAAVVFVLLGIELNNLAISQQRKNLPAIEWPVALVKGLPVLAVLLLVQLMIAGQWLLAALPDSGQPMDGFVIGASQDIYLSLLKGLGFVGFFALSLLMLTNKDRIRQAIWIVVLAAGFQAIYGAFMVLTGLEYGFFVEKSDYRGKATGTFINRNHLAGYLEMALAMGIGFLLASTTRYKGNWRQRLRQGIEMLLSPKVLMRILLAIMVIALVLSRSRMGNTAFFASLMIAGGLALLLMKNKSRSTTILLSSLLVIDIAIVGTFFGVEKVADRLQKTSVEKESRDEVSRDTFEMWKDNPVLGIGAGTYKTIYPSYKSADVRSEKLYDHAHNDYLQFLAEFGLIAFTILFAAVGWCFYWAIEAMRKRRSSLHKGLGFGAAMGMIAIGIHSTVDFNLQIPANAFMFMLLMAMAVIARWGPYKG